MFRNYIKVAVRTLMKNKLFTFINVFGLALSMSVCMLVLVHIKEQLGYDSFHPQSDKIYRVITELKNEQGAAYRFATTPLPFLEKLKSSYDVIDKSARVYLPGKQLAKLADKKQLEINGAFCDADFFSMFGFSVESGNVANLLTLPNRMVLSEQMAIKLFGKEVDAIGQSIDIADWGQFIVAGVLRKSPAKSHLDYEAYFSMSSVAALESAGKLRPLLDQWDNFNNSYTYVTLKKGNGRGRLETAVAAVSDGLMKSQANKGASIKFEAQSFNSIVLGEELIANAGNTGSRGKLMAEAAIGLIILISACFNYTNLSIARSLNRGKEVGIRKVSGARRWNVFGQFVLESLIVAIISFGLAFVFLQLLTDFMPLSAEILPDGYHFDFSLFIWFLVFTLFAGLMAGIIPAWTLSSFKPVQVLKNLNTIKLFGTNGLRKSLIVVQFVLSLVIILFTLTFSRQFDYMANADPLFNRANIFNVQMQGMQAELLEAELRSISGVQKIAVASELPGKNTSGTVTFKQSPSDQPISVNYYDANADFIAMLNLKFVAGNSFTPIATNAIEQYTIINEKMLPLLSVKTADEAIGKQLLLNDTIPVQVIAVVRDFYFQGMEWTPGPLLLRNRQASVNQLMVKTTAETAQLRSAFELAWKKIFPYQEFKGDWYLQSTSARYSAVSTMSMLGFLAFITISIACLGLLGMVTYVTQTRYKEIGVRKVMGAGVSTIMVILSKGFIKLVFIASAIGLPLGYLAGYFFLNIFSNRVTLGVDLLVYGFAGMLLLVLLTISWQIYKVAVANPVEALKNE